MIRLDVVNDGTGTPETGNYDVRLILPNRGHPIAEDPWRTVFSRVEGFDRSRGAVELMRLALDAVEPKLD